MHDMVRRNPPVVPADTSPDVWRRQMEAIAARSPAERLAEWTEFNVTMSRLEAEAVRRRHPYHDDDQVLRALVRHRYGDELTGAAWPDRALVEP
jgi:hypothetical protein